MRSASSHKCDQRSVGDLTIVEKTDWSSRAPNAASLHHKPDSRIVLIDKRPLMRECLAKCIEAAGDDRVVSFATIDEWLVVAERTRASVLVLWLEFDDAGDNREQFEVLARLTGRHATIVLADGEDVSHIYGALDRGARGYIPASLPLDIAVRAIHLVKAGGMFVPAKIVLAARREPPASDCNHDLFTARQAAVVRALSQGKANKIIAHELNMRESTVKVHVRNIMKKLSAKNRTEVALLANGLLRQTRVSNAAA